MFGFRVRTSNDDIAMLLRLRCTADRDRDAGTRRAVVPSTQSVRVCTEWLTLGREDVRQTDLKVVQTVYYIAPYKRQVYSQAEFGLELYLFFISCLFKHRRQRAEATCMLVKSVQ